VIERRLGRWFSAAPRSLLAPVYGRFTECFDTLDLKEAKGLLKESTPDNQIPQPTLLQCMSRFLAQTDSCRNAAIRSLSEQ
jgi:hypothetical protein